MSKNDFVGTIHSLYNQFTKAERKVADYVTAHAKDVLFMSITELADACGVGETSVFRFCRTLGVGGYQEFKMQLSLGMREEEPHMSNAEATGTESLPARMQEVLKSSQSALEQTAALLNPAALEQAVQILSRARRIVFFGVGASLLSAQKAANKFLRVEPNTVCYNDPHTQAMLAATMGKEDAAVVFSHSGSTKDTNAVAKLAQRNGAKVISITRFQKSPLTEFSDVILLCGANESPLEGGSAGADICQSFLMELMYTEYCRSNKEKCEKNNKKAAASVLDKLY